jgi:hypothetical protein
VAAISISVNKYGEYTCLALLSRFACQAIYIMTLPGYTTATMVPLHYRVHSMGDDELGYEGVMLTIGT